MNLEQIDHVSRIITDCKALDVFEKKQWASDLLEFGDEAYKNWSYLNYEGGMRVVKAKNNLDVMSSGYVYYKHGRNI